MNTYHKTMTAHKSKEFQSTSDVIDETIDKCIQAIAEKHGPVVLKSASLTFAYSNIFVTVIAEYIGAEVRPYDYPGPERPHGPVNAMPSIVHEQ